jgi:hypothetical protein
MLIPILYRLGLAEPGGAVLLVVMRGKSRSAVLSFI